MYLLWWGAATISHVNDRFSSYWHSRWTNFVKQHFRGRGGGMHPNNDFQVAMRNGVLKTSYTRNGLGPVAGPRLVFIFFLFFIFIPFFIYIFLYFFKSLFYIFFLLINLYMFSLATYCFYSSYSSIFVLLLLFLIFLFIFHQFGYTDSIRIIILLVHAQDLFIARTDMNTISIQWMMHGRAAPAPCRDVQGPRQAAGRAAPAQPAADVARGHGRVADGAEVGSRLPGFPIPVGTKVIIINLYAIMRDPTGFPEQQGSLARAHGVRHRAKFVG